MKKLIEASGDYSFENSYQVKASVLRKAFNAGAEFVQRWIPVDEELPKNRGQVLCKGINFTEVLSYGGNFDGWMSCIDMEAIFNVTHWRPIEIK